MLVLILIKSMVIRVIEEIVTPTFIAINHVFFSILSLHALPLLFITIIFVTSSRENTCPIIPVLLDIQKRLGGVVLRFNCAKDMKVHHGHGSACEAAEGRCCVQVDSGGG